MRKQIFETETLHSIRIDILAAVRRAVALPVSVAGTVAGNIVAVAADGGLIAASAGVAASGRFSERALEP